MMEAPHKAKCVFMSCLLRTSCPFVYRLRFLSLFSRSLARSLARSVFRVVAASLFRGNRVSLMQHLLFPPQAHGDNPCF